MIDQRYPKLLGYFETLDEFLCGYQLKTGIYIQNAWISFLSFIFYVTGIVLFQYANIVEEQIRNQQEQDKQKPTTYDSHNQIPTDQIKVMIYISGIIFFITATFFLYLSCLAYKAQQKESSAKRYLQINKILFMIETVIKFFAIILSISRGDPVLSLLINGLIKIAIDLYNLLVIHSFYYKTYQPNQTLPIQLIQTEQTNQIPQQFIQQSSRYGQLNDEQSSYEIEIGRPIHTPVSNLQSIELGQIQK